MTQDDRLALESWMGKILIRLDVIGVALEGLSPLDDMAICTRAAHRNHYVATTETAKLKQWLLGQLGELRGRPID